MTIHIQSIGFNADAEFLSLITSKLPGVDKLYEKIIRIDVFLRLENLSSKVKQKITEIRIKIPGKTIFAKSTGRTFEVAFDKSYRSVVTQLKRKRQKQVA